MGSWRVPFNEVSVVGEELRYVASAASSGHLAGDGPFAARCTAILEEVLGAPRVLLTPSCSHALEMCALLLGFEPGDEVIVPSFAFVTTAGAFAMHGARPVFADVEPATLNLDPASVAERIGPRTRAIVALHYGGVACRMQELATLAAEAGASLLEDNAHGLFGSYRGRVLGSFGAMSTLSFHETKNLTCGEGGALVLNDPALIERAEIVREKGTDRARFFRGEVDRYTWRDLGSSFLPSELQCAFLCGQLEARERIQTTRRKAWRRYETALESWATEHGVALPSVPEGAEPPHHLFYLVLPTPSGRDGLIQHLRERGILAPFHYLPLHLSPVGRRLGGEPGQCPVSEDLSDRLIRLPLFYALDEARQSLVIDSVLEFRETDA